jgi:hypothetical protein
MICWKEWRPWRDEIERWRRGETRVEDLRVFE